MKALARQDTPKATPEVRALQERANQALNRGDIDGAGRGFDQALAKARELKDRKGEADALRGVGVVTLRRGESAKGVALLKEALALSRAIGDAIGEGRGLMVLGNEAMGREDRAVAREHFQRAIAILRPTDDLAGLGGCLVNLGLIETEGDTERAIALFREALPVLKRSGNRLFEANAQNGLGNLYRRTGRNALAVAPLQEALSIYRELGNDEAVAGAQLNLGLALREINEPVKARQALETALASGHRLQNPVIEGQAAGALATLVLDSDPDRARRLYQDSIRIAEVSGDRKLAAASHLNLGAFYLVTSRWRQAREHFQSALAACQAAGDLENEAMAQGLIAQSYVQTGQLEPAREAFERALALHEIRKDPVAIAGALHDLSSVYLDSGQLDRAEANLKRSLAITREAAPELGVGDTMANLALVYLDRKQFDAAREAGEEGLKEFRARGDARGEGRSLGFLGDLYYRTGNLDAAIQNLEASLPILRRVADWYVVAANLTVLGHVLTAQKRLPEAVRRYDEAIALTEGFRNDLGALHETKSRYLQTQLPLYYSALSARLEMGDLPGAFTLAQKTKARTLIDLMQEGRISPTAGLTPVERQRLAALRTQADRINVQMMRESVENKVGAKRRFADLKRELEGVERKLQALTETLYASHPGLAERSAARVAGYAEIARSLPPDTALLEYVVLSNQQLAVFVVTSDTRQAPVAHVLELEYAQFVGQAAALRGACADPRKPYRSAASALHRRLLSPVATALSGKRRLVVCPDGALWDIPFQALVDDAGRFVAERFEVVYGYSATGVLAALAAHRRRRAPRGTLLTLANPDFGSAKRFGDLEGVPGQRPIDSPSRPIDSPSRPLDSPSRPLDSPSRPLDSPSRAFDAVSRGGAIVPLPGTQREADALRRLFPGSAVLTGKAAQESSAKSKASQYKYLHFATHGVFNDASPMLSSLVLAQPSPGSGDDGFLTAREIFEMDLSAEMTVLSACNTARGVQRTGDGIVGLTWALFVAGCPTQVVSQWSVDDASTATLMTRFYGTLAKGKLGKGAALRQASLSLLDDPKRRHPYYWAPFVLMGDWR